MDARKIIRQIIRECVDKVFENVQMADKVYFKPEKLSKNVRDIIVSRITGGDNYTKIISDIYYAYLQQSEEIGKFMSSVFKLGDDKPSKDEKSDILNINELKEIKQLYEDLKEYNSNVFPIEGLDVYNPKDVWNIINGLKQRRRILELFKKLPSIAWRNMKTDIRTKRDGQLMQSYRSDLEYFLGNYSLLDNRSEETKNKILQKMFKSETNLHQLLDFAEEKQNLLGGAEFTREQIKEMAQTEDFEIIYDAGNAMIVRVDSPRGIKAIGCNSLWCFTYGSGFDDAYRQWNNYSHNDVVYVIVDFRYESDDQDFMHVLIKPLTDKNGRFLKFKEEREDEHPLFNMSNDNWQNPYMVLNDIFGSNYKNIVKKYMNFRYDE